MAQLPGYKSRDAADKHIVTCGGCQPSGSGEEVSRLLLGTSVMENLSGHLFGVYHIVEPLGAGGMAAVYKAYQPSVDRYIALKILPSRLAKDPEFLGRFEQEAKLLANLQYPHVLSVHDFGESDGFTYIVMPVIKTGTLAAPLRGEPLPFGQIKRVITQVGDALDCAHAQGLLHRDVKPINILLDERGNCLPADFGIAKILEEAEPLTATGGVGGHAQVYVARTGVEPGNRRPSEIRQPGGSHTRRSPSRICEAPHRAEFE